MDWLYPLLGDLNEVPALGREMVGFICILASALCGAVIGMERERRHKPAGLRTLVLIALGSTIFTLVSLLLARQKATADPARLAAQIIPGIGFLGAGAIIQSRGTVVGLTTGATIWAVSAVGVAIGSGYVAAGFFFTVSILLTLTVLNRVEWGIAGPCRFERATVVYGPQRGKSLPRLQAILDRYRISDSKVVCGERTPSELTLEIPVCQRHREHRSVLLELAELPEVVALEVEGPGRA